MSNDSWFGCRFEQMSSAIIYGLVVDVIECPLAHGSVVDASECQLIHGLVCNINECQSVHGAVVDVNECQLLHANVCPRGYTCENTRGSYRCIRPVVNCDQGFVLDTTEGRCIGKVSFRNTRWLPYIPPADVICFCYIFLSC